MVKLCVCGIIDPRYVYGPIGSMVESCIYGGIHHKSENIIISV